ncbi:MAG: exodeoxyribonuclease VII large subunit [Eubacteriales bacterium]|nr:exodeoxyribonuclease VII large subunit [Eubacteriales bacterium]
MRNVYSVGQVNRYIQTMFTQDYLLKRLYVKGELSNVKYHSSGHIYFSLKDESGSIACVMFAGNRRGLAFRMQDGQSVIVLGSVSVYERDGKYQLYANEIRLDGLGLLYEKYEALKKELEEMGMFAEEYKQQIPTHIRKLGIVTASTGAAIRDIMNVAHRRNPYVQLILYPAQVQGEGAAQSVVRGIETLDKAGVDTIIIGRGGGSIEDLWAFNEEIVARAVFECRTPVISAVGHETDFTIADFVADLRAPTPSAAAELAVEDISAVLQELKEGEQKLGYLMQQHLSQAHQRADYLGKRLQGQSPMQQLRENRQRLIEKEDRLQLQMQRQIQEKRHRLQILIEQYRGLSPLEKLNQGYSYTADEEGRAVYSVADVQEKDELKVYVSDGIIRAEVKSTETGIAALQK